MGRVTLCLDFAPETWTLRPIPTMTSASPGDFPSLKMVSLNYLMTSLKQQDGNLAPQSIGTLKMMDLLSSVISTKNLRKIVSDAHQFDSLENFKKTLLQRMRTNFVAYLGNQELSNDWTAGYEQAILDLKYKMDQM
jgi:hypothetical protein